MKNDVMKFLLGEGSLDGVWFGDKHPTEKGAFWWRKHLRQFITQNQPNSGNTDIVRPVSEKKAKPADPLLKAAMAQSSQAIINCVRSEGEPLPAEGVAQNGSGGFWCAEDFIGNKKCAIYCGRCKMA